MQDYNSSIIGENNKPPSFVIDDYSFYVKNGVIDINIQHRDNYGWDIKYSDIKDYDVEEYYYYIDGIYDEAFGHWIFESGIYLHIFSRLKEKYPSIKILSFKSKDYKNITYNAYNISAESIVNKIENYKNKVIFIKCSSLADHNDCELYLSHIRRWHKYLNLQIQIEEKDIDILYLPRSDNNNYRNISDLSKIQGQLIPILNTIPGVNIYYTDTTKNIIEQIKVIKRSKLIILNEGSNHNVNGFFAENSHIIVLGGNGPGNGYHFQNPRPALIYYDSIKRGNLYYHISYSESISNIINLIDKIQNKSIKAYPPPPVNCWRENWMGCKTCNEKKWKYSESL
jgi:hypothetical protein